jgi:hypothetical protein
LHADLIDSPEATRLLTFLNMDSLSVFEKRRLFACVGVEGTVCGSIFSIFLRKCAKFLDCDADV